jgi:hypothetical protein
MLRRWTLIIVALSFFAFIGCNQSPKPAAAPADPAAQAAYDFLDAVLKGDTGRASQHLTPLAIERIEQSGKQFKPPGIETATFRIGEVRKPSENQAIVQCFLTDTSAPQPAPAEEIGCLLRLVDNNWRVSGIAYLPAPNKPPMILNFEMPQQGAVTSQPQMVAAPEAGQPTMMRSSPPQTADQQVAPAASYR